MNRGKLGPPECPCNTIPDGGPIQVYQGRFGQVVIKQADAYDEDDVVLVLPELIPRLVKMLEAVAAEIGEGSPEHEHDEPEASS